MQAVLNNNISNITNITANISEKLDFLLSDVDSNTKNDVENKIVALGAHAVDALIDKLTTSKGLTRGIIAMSLIRIGEACVEPLKEFASENREFGWMADYLISEI